MTTRRKFIQGIAGTAVMATSAKSYANILGANDRLNVAVMGTRSRGKSLLGDLIKSSSSNVTHICDVDREILDSTVSYIASLDACRPKGHSDVRHVLDDPNLDALVVATPDHWHATATIMGLKAGKHVYLEKPCGYDPHEGELLEKAQKKYDRVVQMGNQQRSSPESIALMQAIGAGEIGDPYHADCWYANNRGSIGNGKVVAAPDRLDWDLWQGPAPRRKYRDNLVPYNWHWFWHWGTAETSNNGTHMIDLMRWGLQVDYPTRVTSAGGRYHYEDDWEMPDSQVLGFDFEGRKSLHWEGRSCSGGTVEGNGVGVVFYGEGGSLKLAGTGYVIYDKKSAVVEDVTGEAAERPLDTQGPGEGLDAYHVRDFLESLRSGTPPNADVAIHQPSTLMPLLGNIAHRLQRDLRCDPRTGRVVDDPEADGLWGRDYEPGWEPKA